MDKIIANVAILSESRPVINYILGGPFEDHYQSERQQKKLLRASTAKAKVNSIHAEGRHEETKPIDGPISFPQVKLEQNCRAPL